MRELLKLIAVFLLLSSAVGQPPPAANKPASVDANGLLLPTTVNGAPLTISSGTRLGGGTATQRGLTKEIWISSRTDAPSFCASANVCGSGTPEDPFDGSTTTKFDAIIAAIASTANIHLNLIGSFTTITGVTINSTGWEINGPATIAFATTVGSALFTGEHRALISSPYNLDAGAKVHDLTLNANVQNVTGAPITNNVKDCALDGVVLYGSNNLIYNVHLSNAYGSLINARESFGLGAIGYYNGVSGVLASNNIVHDCIVDSPRGDYMNAIVNSGWNGAKTPGMVGCIIRDCRVSDYTPPTSTATITIASPGVVTWTGHGLNNGDTVNFTTTGALPTGLTVGTQYYVVNRATNTIQVSATNGGSAINTSGSQSGVHTIYQHTGMGVAFSSNIVVNNTSTNCQFGARWEPATSLVVTGNKFLNCRERGISIEDTSGVTDALIQNNLIELRDDDPVRDWGIFVLDNASSKNVNISYNTIKRKVGGNTCPSKYSIVGSVTAGVGFSITNNKIDTVFSTVQIPTDTQIFGNRKLDNSTLTGLPDSLSIAFTDLTDELGLVMYDDIDPDNPKLSLSNHTRGLYDASEGESILWEDREAWGSSLKSFSWYNGGINVGGSGTNGIIELDSSNGGDGIYFGGHTGGTVQLTEDGDGLFSGNITLGGLNFSDSSFYNKLLTVNSGGSVLPLANTSAALAGFLSDPTGFTTGAQAVFNINPIILRPLSAMTALVIDVTKINNTKSIAASTTFTLSATPSSGTTFGVIVTTDSTARVVTLPSGTWKSEARGGATITTLTIPASSSVTLIAQYEGSSTYRLYGEPLTINDLTTKATPIGADSVSIYDSVAGIDSKATITSLATAVGGAPSSATYITQTSNGTLSAEQALASLATGIVKNTTTTGVLSIATDGTDYLSSTTGQPLDSDLTSWAAITRASGFDTFATTPSSANLKTLVTDETGSGALVFATSPTLVTPVLGAATATSYALTNGGIITDGGTGAITLTASGTNQNITLAPSGSGSILTSTAIVKSNAGMWLGTNSSTAPTTRTVDLLQYDGTLVSLGSGVKMVWESTSNITAAKDTGLSRNAAGVVEVNNGTVGGAGALIMAQVPAANTATSLGLQLTDTTAATSGNQQYSPSVRWTGQGWKTTSTAASQAVDFRAYVVPVQGTTNPAATWTLESSVNGGAFGNALKLSTDGTLTIPGNIDVNGVTRTITNGVNSFLTFNSNNCLLVSGNGIFFNSINSTSGMLINRQDLSGNNINSCSIASGSFTTPSVWNDSNTAASGTVANRFLLGIAAPTLTATNSSVTNTVASTVYIGGAPTDSTNTTSTTKYALNVAAGTTNLGGGLKGTATNDSATAGNAGEYSSSLIASGSAVGLTTATAANVTSISLTAGDWDVEGNVNFTETVATATARSASIGITSATLATDGSEVTCGVQSTLVSEVNSITVPRKRISISGTTTVYLVASANFSAGTVSSYGGITARRIR